MDTDTYPESNEEKEFFLSVQLALAGTKSVPAPDFSSPEGNLAFREFCHELQASGEGPFETAQGWLLTYESFEEGRELPAEVYAEIARKSDGETLARFKASSKEELHKSFLDWMPKLSDVPATVHVASVSNVGVYCAQSYEIHDWNQKQSWFQGDPIWQTNGTIEAVEKFHEMQANQGCAVYSLETLTGCQPYRIRAAVEEYLRDGVSEMFVEISEIGFDHNPSQLWSGEFQFGEAAEGLSEAFVQVGAKIAEYMRQDEMLNFSGILKIGWEKDGIPHIYESRDVIDAEDPFDLEEANKVQVGDSIREDFDQLRDSARAMRSVRI